MMKIVPFLLSVIIVALLLGGTSEGKHSERRAPKDLNVKEPLVEIKAAYDNFKAKFDILSIIKLVIKLVPCIIQALIPSSSSSEILHLAKVINSQTELNNAQLKLIAEKLAELPLPNIEFEEPFCNTTLFKSIHKAMWVDDKQLEDLVHFLGRFGFPEIYLVIDQAYNECPDLKDGLPKAPTPRSESKSKPDNQLNANSKLPNVREQLLQSRQHQPRQEQTCDILGIITSIPDTGLIQLVQLFETLTKQFNTNHNLHFLVGKIQEPVKGISVRKFHELPAVQELLKILHKTLFQGPKWQEFFMIIKQLLGVDLNEINLLEFIYSLVEFLAWGTPFPVVPPPTI